MVSSSAPVARFCQAEPESGIFAIPFKVCSCCKRAFTHAEWDALEALPNWVMEWGAVYEVRNCGCGSTIMHMIVEGDPEET